MKRTLSPSAEIEAQIEQLLAVGVGENPREALSELAKLGARLIVQRAARTSSTRGLAERAMSAGPIISVGFATTSGAGNGYRARRVQTAEGELEVESRRSARRPSRSCLRCSCTRRSCWHPAAGGDGRWRLRPRPLDARSNRCASRRGSASSRRSTASRICQELRERFEQFKRRDLYGVGLVALFLDAIFLNVRPKGPKEGVLCAWGFTEQGERVLVGVCLGMRESHEDWLSLARDLIACGRGAPMLVVADGAPGLIKAVEQCWPSSDRQHCSVHRARNLIAKLPSKTASGRAGPIGRRSTRPRTSATEGSGSGPRRRARADRVCVGREMPRGRSRCSRRPSALPATPPQALAFDNLLERTLGEVKRRTKVIGRFPGEESCLSLVWDVLDLQINNTCNGVRLSDIDRHKLYRLRHQPAESDAEHKEVAAA